MLNELAQAQKDLAAAQFAYARALESAKAWRKNIEELVLGLDDHNVAKVLGLLDDLSTTLQTRCGRVEPPHAKIEARDELSGLMSVYVQALALMNPSYFQSTLISARSTFLLLMRAGCPDRDVNGVSIADAVRSVATDDQRNRALYDQILTRPIEKWMLILKMIDDDYVMISDVAKKIGCGVATVQRSIDRLGIETFKTSLAHSPTFVRACDQREIFLNTRACPRDSFTLSLPLSIQYKLERLSDCANESPSVYIEKLIEAAAKR